ncbi:MAG: hypothetical protein KKB51_08840 [Candidatus Riflebacteria bacterium]|nr:hypothetical protein [Candidatus Riflebacteria bacterium]
MALFLVGSVLWQASLARPEILTQIGLKAELTRLSVMAEYQPLWLWPLVFLAITLLMMMGVPSLICFAGLLGILGFYVAFIITFLCQVFVTRISIHRAWKRADSVAYQQSINPALKSLLWQNQEKFKTFAFWARVYFAYPLRTIDFLTPMIQPDEEHLGKTLTPAAAAIFLRMLIPTFWLDSVLTLIKNVAPTSTADTSTFLLWSSALIAYTMIPRVPELFVCPEAVKRIVEQIEKPPVDKTKSSSKNENTQAETPETGKTRTKKPSGQSATGTVSRRPAI